MNKFSTGQKCGLAIELFAGIIMAILVIIGQPIPNLVAWLFIVGLIVTLVFSLIKARAGK